MVRTVGRRSHLPRRQLWRGRQSHHAHSSRPRPPAIPTMASGFIGISVIVTLQNPPNTLVHGVVAAVNPQNATLTLQDGASPSPRSLHTRAGSFVFADSYAQCSSLRAATASTRTMSRDTPSLTSKSTCLRLRLHLPPPHSSRSRARTPSRTPSTRRTRPSRPRDRRLSSMAAARLPCSIPPASLQPSRRRSSTQPSSACRSAPRKLQPLASP